MFGVYRDELVTDTDRQLFGGEVLHIQINDKAIPFDAHLSTDSAAVSSSAEKRVRRTHRGLFSPAQDLMISSRRFMEDKHAGNG